MAQALKRFLIPALTISAVTILIAVVAQLRLPPQIPLFYGLPEGENQLTGSVNLALPGIFSFLICLLNLLAIRFIKDVFLQKSLAGAALVTSIFGLITTVKIIFLVGSI